MIKFEQVWDFLSIIFHGVKLMVIIYGSLIRNDPLKLVVEETSPYIPKRLSFCDVYYNNFPSFPNNILESWHRARYILFIGNLVIGNLNQKKCRNFI
ncbi:MAG: hypothetical protein ACRD8K_02755 [Nitrososphaeraceae archaeon]